MMTGKELMECTTKQYKEEEMKAINEFNGMTVEEKILHFAKMLCNEELEVADIKLAKKLCNGDCDNCKAYMACDTLFGSTDACLAVLTEEEALEALK